MRAVLGTLLEEWQIHWEGGHMKTLVITSVTLLVLVGVLTFPVEAISMNQILTKNVRGTSDTRFKELRNARLMLVQSQNRRDLGPPAPQLDPVESIKPRIVKGPVLRIDGDHYIIKDADSVEVRFHVSQETKKHGQDRFKVGDQIEAKVLPDGHAEFLRPRGNIQ